MKVLFEKVTAAGDASFRIGRAVGKAFGAPYHAHPEVEITWIGSGTGDLVVGDHFGRFSAGDVFVHGGGLPHAYRAAVGSSAETVFVQFLARDFGELFWALPEMRAVGTLCERAARGLRLSRMAARRVALHLEALDGARGAERIGRLIQVLDAAAVDRRSQPLASAGYAPPRRAAGATRVAAILAAIDDGWRGEADLASVARTTGLHPRSLSRFCRRHFKKSFSTLLIERRLGEAARRILETDATISEIAFATGFNNLSNFHRLFRNATGFSPTGFRARATFSAGKAATRGWPPSTPQAGPGSRRHAAR